MGLYAVYLLDWLSVFRKEQLLVLRLEDHASDVKSTLHRVFHFLGLGMGCRTPPEPTSVRLKGEVGRKELGGMSRF